MLQALKKAGRTMSAEDLAAHVKQAGYQTTRKDLKEKICKMMAKVPEVERDPKDGYRLKKIKV